jgi:hypothetical protein
LISINEAARPGAASCAGNIRTLSVRHFEARLAAASPWLMAGLLAAFAGWLSMTKVAQAGVICGLHNGTGHCAACYAAAALVLMGFVVFAAPRPALKRIPVRSR